MARFNQRALSAAATLMLAQSPAFAQSASSASEPGGSSTRVLVIPYQPIYRSASQRKANTATDYLNKELGTKETIQVLRAGVTLEGQEQPSLEAAMTELEKAKEAEADHRVTDAIAARSRAIELMEANAAAIPTADDYILAHHRLARAQFWSGDDTAGTKTLEIAARMNPNMELPAEEFSRWYRQQLSELRKELSSERRAELLVRSVLPGAEVFIDGREMDTAPVRLEEVVVGKHLLGAEAEGAQPTKAVVEVKAGEKAEFTVAFGQTLGGPSVGKVADSITENRLPTDAVAAAKEAGQSADARYVVLGGLAKDVDHFNVHTFVLDVPTGKLKQLDVTQFDLDLLTAESDVLRVVLGVEQALEQFDGALAQANVIEKRIRQAEVIQTAKAEPDFTRKAGPTKKKRSGPKRPKVRAPIRAPTDLDIKDD